MEIDDDEIAAIGFRTTGQDFPIDPCTYLEAVEKAEISGYGVLRIFRNLPYRKKAKKDEIKTLFEKITEMDLKAHGIGSQTQKPPLDISWATISDGIGLICAKNKATYDYLRILIPKIPLGESSLKAWSKGENGEGKLVTGFFYGEIWKTSTGPELMEYLASKNNAPILKNGYINAKSKPSNTGVTLNFWACKDLCQYLDSLREPDQEPGRSSVKLRVGLNKTKFTFWTSPQSGLATRTVNSVPESEPTDPPTVIPEVPEVPEVQEDPKVPEDPEVPEVEEVPEVQEDPEVPEVQKDPEVPVVPEVPEVSEVQEVPEVPEVLEILREIGLI